MVNKHFLRLSSFSRRFSLYMNLEKDTRMLQLPKRNMTSDISESQAAKEKLVFEDALPGIVDNLVNSPKLAPIPEARNWIKHMIELNLRRGKHFRGLVTAQAYAMLEKPENITQESVQLSRVLGWCVEMLQAHLIIVDDIVDQSTTRRGEPCWYRMPNVGLSAINDSVLVYTAITSIIDIYFGKTPLYTDVLRLFNETLQNTCLGQYLDNKMSKAHKKDYGMFTMDRYNSIAKYKTACYTVKLPVFLALLLLKDVDKSMHSDIEEICMDLGRLFQIQDDYIDVYGNELMTGKAGTDIQENKCTWLAVTTLQRCNERQRDTFTKYYGSKNPSHVKCIKQLYDQLQIPDLYSLEEIKLHNDIERRIRALPNEMAPKLFFKFLDTFYKRTS